MLDGDISRKAAMSLKVSSLEEICRFSMRSPRFRVSVPVTSIDGGVFHKGMTNMSLHCQYHDQDVRVEDIMTTFQEEA